MGIARDLAAAAGLACGTLIAALVLSGCQSRNHPAYGADDFQRIGNVRGYPAYKATGYHTPDMAPAFKARSVVLAACPDGNPQMLDGMWGSKTSYSFQESNWWWITFTCEREISLP